VRTLDKIRNAKYNFSVKIRSLIFAVLATFVWTQSPAADTIPQSQDSSTLNFNLNATPAPITFGNANGLNTATAMSTPAYMLLQPPKSSPPYLLPQPRPASQSSYNFNLNATPAPITFGNGNGLNTTTAGSTPATAFPANSAVFLSRSAPVLYTPVAGQAPPPMCVVMPMPPPMSTIPKYPPYSPPQPSPASQSSYNPNTAPIPIILGNGNLNTTTAGPTPAPVAGKSPPPISIAMPMPPPMSAMPMPPPMSTIPKIPPYSPPQPSASQNKEIIDAIQAGNRAEMLIVPVEGIKMGIDSAVKNVSEDALGPVLGYGFEKFYSETENQFSDPQLQEKVQQLDEKQKKAFAEDQAKNKAYWDTVNKGINESNVKIQDAIDGMIETNQNPRLGTPAPTR
jgi:hypothetical protein